MADIAIKQFMHVTTIAGESIASGDAIVIRDNQAFKAPFSWRNGGESHGFALNSVKLGEMLVYVSLGNVVLTAEESQALFKHLVDMNSYGYPMTLSKGDVI